MFQNNHIYYFFLIPNLYVEIYCQKALQGMYQPQPMCPICTSEIYCFGELLDDVQMARIFPDSKTFVDMKLLKSEAEIVRLYKDLKAKNNSQIPSCDVLKQFVSTYFAEDPLIEWTPTDFSDTPTVATITKDPTYKNWILNLNNIWKELARKVNSDVQVNPQRYSAIYLPNGFFIAGGRFRELYYWDSFWITRGALTCDMKVTVKGILENFIHLVKQYGYVPNGSRVYYLLRSQPPLLIQMVASYIKFTSDTDFLRTNIEHLETEFTFWMKNRLVRVEKTGSIYFMAQYNTRTKGPRPESYYEDKTLAMSLPSDSDKNELYSRLKSAAESGWDFSSKHYNNFGKNTGNLTNTDPQNFIYVELNAILQSNAVVLSEMFGLLGNTEKQNCYSEIGRRFQIGINDLLWDDKEGMWFDYDLTIKSNRKFFYVSNFAPLWTGSYDKNKNKYFGRRALEYLSRNQYINADYTPKMFCIPTSSVQNTDQQWDYPNCWPPLQMFIIQGLYNTEFPNAQIAAMNLAKAWIKTNYAGYVQKKSMFEKYSALEFGSSGAGGEYIPQTGFGWTNGVVLELFWNWGDLFQYS